MPETGEVGERPEAGRGRVSREVEAKIVAAIRASHLKANISDHEGNPFAPAQTSVIHWGRATVDPGGTIFGAGPYIHVPITLLFDPPLKIAGDLWGTDEITVRVYPPERLRRKLAKLLSGSPSVLDSVVPREEKDQ